MCARGCRPPVRSDDLAMHGDSDYHADAYDYDMIQTDPDMPSPARVRWIDAFNKVCAQLNNVSGWHFIWGGGRLARVETLSLTGLMEDVVVFFRTLSYSYCKAQGGRQ